MLIDPLYDYKYLKKFLTYNLLKRSTFKEVFGIATENHSEIKMSVFQEIKTFALKGNMVDLAIGVIIGAAFGKVVSSLVADVIMPPVGLLLGDIDFNAFQVVLKQATESHPPVSIKYGTFINTLIDFLIVSIVIFFAIKGMNKLRREKRAEPSSKECPDCLSSIPLQAKKCKYCTSFV